MTVCKSYFTLLSFPSGLSQEKSSPPENFSKNYLIVCFSSAWINSRGISLWRISLVKSPPRRFPYIGFLSISVVDFKIDVISRCKISDLLHFYCILTSIHDLHMWPPYVTSTCYLHLRPTLGPTQLWLQHVISVCDLYLQDNLHSRPQYVTSISEQSTWCLFVTSLIDFHLWRPSVLSIADLYQWPYVTSTRCLHLWLHHVTSFSDLITWPLVVTSICTWPPL